MNTISKSHIVELWSGRPEGITYPPATIDEISDFESVHTCIPHDYKWFLLECGSGVIGSEWLDGIDDLFSSHQKFREECAIEDGWKHKSQFIIGWDGSGSPIGLSSEGQVCVEHPGVSELVVLSESLADYLVAGLAE